MMHPYCFCRETGELAWRDSVRREHALRDLVEDNAEVA